MGVNNRWRNLIYPGSACTITDGPLAEYDARVLDFENEDGEVRVETQVFGRATPVAIKADRLEPVSRAETLLECVKGRNLSTEIMLDGFVPSLGAESLFIEEGLLRYAGDSQFVICRPDKIRTIRYTAADCPGSLWTFLELDTHIIYFDVFNLGDPDTFRVYFPKMKKLLTGDKAREFMRDRAFTASSCDMQDFLDPTRAEAYLDHLHDSLMELSHALDWMVRWNTDITSREEALSTVSTYLQMDQFADARVDEFVDERVDEFADEHETPIEFSFRDMKKVLGDVAQFTSFFGLTTTVRRRCSSGILQE